MRKVISAMLLAVALVFVGGQTNQVEAFSYPAHVVGIRTFLSLRAEPSIYSRELTRIPNGAYLDVLATDSEHLPGVVISNGFYEVVYRGMTGWAHSDYLHIDR